MAYERIITNWESRKRLLEHYKRVFKIKLSQLQNKKVSVKNTNKNEYFKSLILNKKKYEAFQNYIKFQISNGLTISIEIIYAILNTEYENNLIHLLLMFHTLTVEDKLSLIDSHKINYQLDNNKIEQTESVEKVISREKILLNNFISIKNYFEFIDNCFTSFIRGDKPIIVESVLNENYLLIGINTKIYKNNNQYKKNLLLLFNQNINEELNNYLIHKLIYNSNRNYGKNSHYYLFMYEISINPEYDTLLNDELTETKLHDFINNLFIN
jgi:hypothetical protein